MLISSKVISWYFGLRSWRLNDIWKQITCCNLTQYYKKVEQIQIREWDRDRQTDRQINRDRQRHTQQRERERQTDRQTDKQRQTETDTQQRERERQTDRQTDKQRQTETDTQQRERERQTDRQGQKSTASERCNGFWKKYSKASHVHCLRYTLWQHYLCHSALRFCNKPPQVSLSCGSLPCSNFRTSWKAVAPTFLALYLFPLMELFPPIMAVSGILLLLFVLQVFLHFVMFKTFYVPVLVSRFPVETDILIAACSSSSGIRKPGCYRYKWSLNIHMLVVQDPQWFPSDHARDVFLLGTSGRQKYNVLHRIAVLNNCLESNFKAQTWSSCYALRHLNLLIE